MNPVESPYDENEEELRKSLEKSLWKHRHNVPGGRLLFTRDEVATVLRTKPATVDKMVATGRISAVVLDEDEPALFRPEAILDLLDGLSPQDGRSSREGRPARDEDR